MKRYTIAIILFLSGMLIGMNLNSLTLKSKHQNKKSIEKLITLLTYIDQDYVDDINMDSLVNEIIIDWDKELKRDSVSN
ncbi:MAG: hypothetical protein OXE77_07600 [Flavobacteriaceae bacterium]|nr:hypothetical protein [Flavobacteriaceae bacterium]MCY4268330.1 hypothetical protein [Flavobacteriaceae bacterium]MCY4300019.1 hypothetical protein [Flavobacteriaceae bacterium]